MHALGGRTPFEVVHKCKPNLKGLLEWGTHVFMLCEGRGKLEERANEGHWVRYSADSQGHRIYWPGKHPVTVERNVNFSIAVQCNGMAEGWQDAPATQNQAQPSLQPSPTSATPHTQTSPPMSTPHTDPLRGFEPIPTDVLGCGQCA